MFSGFFVSGLFLATLLGKLFFSYAQPNRPEEKQIPPKNRTHASEKLPFASKLCAAIEKKRFQDFCDLIESIPSANVCAYQGWIEDESDDAEAGRTTFTHPSQTTLLGAMNEPDMWHFYYRRRQRIFYHYTDEQSAQENLKELCGFFFTDFIWGSLRSTHQSSAPVTCTSQSHCANNHITDKNLAAHIGFQQDLARKHAWHAQHMHDLEALYAYLMKRIYDFERNAHSPTTKTEKVAQLFYLVGCEAQQENLCHLFHLKQDNPDTAQLYLCDTEDNILCILVYSPFLTSELFLGLLNPGVQVFSPKEWCTLCTHQ